MRARAVRISAYYASTGTTPHTEECPAMNTSKSGMLPRVKLRLGRVGFEGQQKGVDLRIGLDMVTHARNGAVDTIVRAQVMTT